MGDRGDLSHREGEWNDMGLGFRVQGSGFRTGSNVQSTI